MGHGDHGLVLVVLMGLVVLCFVTTIGASSAEPQQDLYKLLGLSRKASIKEIKQVR